MGNTVSSNAVDVGAAAFRFFRPRGPLRPFVESFYSSSLSSAFLDGIEAYRLPELEVQLVFAVETGNSLPGGGNLGGGKRACLFVQPPHLQMMSIPTTIREAVGVSFKPTGLPLVFEGKNVRVVERPLLPLDEIWGGEARRLMEALLGVSRPIARLAVLARFLRARLPHTAPPSRLAVGAVERIRRFRGALSTEGLADECGCSSRTLRSLVVSETGLAPKHLARVLRVRHALELVAASGMGLSEASLTSAFSDQSHMTREFRGMLGAAPKSLAARINRGGLPRYVADRPLLNTGLLVLGKDLGS